MIYSGAMPGMGAGYVTWHHRHMEAMPNDTVDVDPIPVFNGYITLTKYHDLNKNQQTSKKCVCIQMPSSQHMKLLATDFKKQKKKHVFMNQDTKYTFAFAKTRLYVSCSQRARRRNDVIFYCHTDVDATSFRRIKVNTTSFCRHAPAGLQQLDRS